MSYLIQTQRLGLRVFTEEDKARFAVINTDSDVMRYYPATLSNQESDALVDRIISQQAKYGYSLYAADHLEADEFIGFIGFLYSDFASPYTPCTEIGWRLDKAFWNQGLATEGAGACLDYGFKKMPLTEIYSWTAVPNRPSAKVMQKIGMQYIANFDHPKLALGHPLREHVVYRINKK
jgi:ribosomal-protein-alanine N-acetyltransferase